MSIVADELMTPAFRFSAPNLEYPLITHARGFAAHLAFGLTVAVPRTGAPRPEQVDARLTAGLVHLHGPVQPKTVR